MFSIGIFSLGCCGLDSIQSTVCPCMYVYWSPLCDCLPRRSARFLELDDIEHPLAPPFLCISRSAPTPRHPHASPYLYFDHLASAVLPFWRLMLLLYYYTIFWPTPTYVITTLSLLGMLCVRMYDRASLMGCYVWSVGRSKWRFFLVTQSHRWPNEIGVDSYSRCSGGCQIGISAHVRVDVVGTYYVHSYIHDKRGHCFHILVCRYRT